MLPRSKDAVQPNHLIAEISRAEGGQHVAGRQLSGVSSCSVSAGVSAANACAPQDVAKSISEQRVRSDELASKHKGRRDKAERMASVLAGVQTAVAG